MIFLSNHNDSGYTRDELRHPKNALETYRTLQILTTCFNDCMSPLAIPLMKTHIMTGLIPCGYVFIRSMNHKFVEEFPGICKLFLSKCHYYNCADKEVKWFNLF